MSWRPPLPEDVPTVAEIVAAMDLTVAGLDLVKKRLAVILRDHVLAAVHGRDYPSSNILVIGPSGGGKTHILRALLDAVPCVWAEGNATEYSDATYRGRPLPSMYHELTADRWRRAEGDEKPTPTRDWLPTAERFGVMVIDEIDKVRSMPTADGRDKGRAIQSELLKLVEGTQALVRLSDEDRNGFMLNTRHVLHIGVGAFQGLGDIIARDLGQNIDWGNYERVSGHHLVQYGFLEELIGRFHEVIVLPPLDIIAMARIFREHVLPVAVQRCADLGVELVVDDGAINHLSSVALKEPFGARSLEPALNDCLWRAKAEVRPGDRIVLDPGGVASKMARVERRTAA